MIIFTKNGATKIVSEDNEAFIKLIESHGWVAEEETEKKEMKNAKSSKSSN